MGGKGMSKYGLVWHQVLSWRALASPHFAFIAFNLASTFLVDLRPCCCQSWARLITKAMAKCHPVIGLTITCPNSARNRRGNCFKYIRLTLIFLDTAQEKLKYDSGLLLESGGREGQELLQDGDVCVRNMSGVSQMPLQSTRRFIYTCPLERGKGYDVHTI